MATIDDVVKLQSDSACPIVVRSGTEVGHADCKTLMDPNCGNPAKRSTETATILIYVRDFRHMSA